MKISQAKLEKLLKQKAQIAALEVTVKEAEASLLDALNNGAEVAKGTFTAHVKTWERRSPSWKDVVERELGTEYATRVLASTKPQSYSKLVVEVSA